MKRLFYLILFSAIVVSCSKDDSETEEIQVNIFKGTSWTANDDISKLIYGGTCTTTIEFIDELNCQEINKRTGTKLFDGTFVNEGTYKFKNDSVTWTVDKHTISGKAVGSVLNTDMGTLSGGKRVYTKD